jgi:hypothetical protein
MRASIAYTIWLDFKVLSKSCASGGRLSRSRAPNPPSAWRIERLRRDTTVVTSDAAVSFTGREALPIAQRKGRPNPWAARRCGDARNGLAERWREAIPSRALVSSEREAGEA